VPCSRTNQPQLRASAPISPGRKIERIGSRCRSVATCQIDLVAYAFIDRLELKRAFIKNARVFVRSIDRLMPSELTRGHPIEIVRPLAFRGEGTMLWTSHVSRLTSHVSRLTSHVSRLTSHVPSKLRVSRFVSCLIAVWAACAVAESTDEPVFRDTWLENLGDYVASPADLAYYEAQRRALQRYVDCQRAGYAEISSADGVAVVAGCAAERSAYVGTLPPAEAPRIAEQVDDAVRRELTGVSAPAEIEP
jgi:hypothetical protein